MIFKSSCGRRLFLRSITDQLHEPSNFGGEEEQQKSSPRRTDGGNLRRRKQVSVEY